MQKDFWRRLFSAGNQKTGSRIILVLSIGVLLLVFGKAAAPADKEYKAEETVTETVKEEDETEERMAEILSKIQGAGEVDVMLTYSTGRELVMAETEKTEESYTEENGKKGETMQREISPVMEEDADGSTAALILKENYPSVEGVVIVAQGGDDPVVKNALTTAAEALLNVPAHKIAVLKME